MAATRETLVVLKWNNLLTEMQGRKMSEAELRSAIPVELSDISNSLSYALLTADYYAPRTFDSVSLRDREKATLEQYIRPHAMKEHSDQSVNDFIHTSYSRCFMCSQDATQVSKSLQDELIACEKFHVLITAIQLTPPLPPDRLVPYLSHQFLIERSLNEVMHQGKKFFSERIRLIDDHEEWFRNQFKSQHQSNRTEFGGHFPLFAEEFRKWATSTPREKASLLALFDTNLKTWIDSDEEHIKDAYVKLKKILESEVDKLIEASEYLEQLSSGEVAKKKSDDRENYVTACFSEARLLSQHLSPPHVTLSSSPCSMLPFTMFPEYFPKSKSGDDKEKLTARRSCIPWLNS